MTANGPHLNVSSEALHRRLIQAAEKLPMLPADVSQALTIARDPDRDIGDFATIVERDQGLTAQILKIANSATFAPPKPIASLHLAVVRLGLNHCRNLIIAATIGHLMQKLTAQQQVAREALWQHGFTTAVIAVRLGRLFQLKFAGEEFTAGLMHDLGRTLLSAALPDDFASVDLLDFQEDDTLLSREQAALGMDHCALGAWYARRNELPGELVAVVEHHHTPEQAGVDRNLVALIAAADHMANHLQRREAIGAYQPETNRAVALLDPLGAHGHVQRFQDEASDVFHDAVRSVVEFLRNAAS